MTLTCTNVTLRQKALRNDRISLYLDYYLAIRNPYTMKMSRREFLGIYLYAKHATSSNECSTKRCSTRRKQYVASEYSHWSMRNSASSTRINRRSISLPTSGQRHEKSMRNGIAFTTTSRNLSVANALLVMSPWNCARSLGITCSNVNRSIIPMLISHAIRQPVIIRRSVPYWK